MVDFNIQQYIILKLDLKAKMDASDTVSVFVANWPLNINDGASDYYVCDNLRSVSGLGLEVGEFISKNSAASIIIDCNLSSNGYQRRLVDWFDRYTPINQTATVYYYESVKPPENVYELESNFDTVFRGNIKDVKFDLTTCRISVDTISDVAEYANYTLPYYGDLFSETAVGSVAPLLIGEACEIKPKLIVESTSSLLAGASGIMYPDVRQGSAIYMTGTCRVNDTGSAWENDGNSGALANDYVLVKDKVGIYRTTYSAPSTWDVYDTTSGTSAPAPIAAGGYFSLELLPGEFSNGTNTGYAFALTAIFSRLKYTSTAPSQGTYYMGILEADDALNVNQTPIAKYTWDYSTLTNALANHYAYFPQPVILDPNKVYYFTCENNTDVSISIELQSGSFTSRRFFIYASTNIFATGLTTGNTLKGKFYAVEFNADYFKYYNHGSFYEKPVKRGKTFHYIEARSLSTSYTDYSKLDIVAAVEGYNDGPDMFYNTPLLASGYLMKIFDEVTLTWGAPTYVSGTYFNTSHTAQTTYPRIFNGPITRKLTATQAVEFLMSESQCKFIWNADQWGVYMHGYSASPSFYLYDKDIIDFGYSVMNRSTVVNYIAAAYKLNFNNPNYTNVFLEDAWYSYKFDYIMGFNDGDIGAAISTNSEELYGIVEKAVQVFDVVTDETSVANCLKLILMLNRLAREYVEVTVPYLEFKDVGLMDIGRVESALLPSHFGSTYAPNDYVYTNVSAVNSACDIIGETGITRNQAVNVQVYKKEVILNNRNNPAMIKFKLKVNNHTGGIW